MKNKIKQRVLGPKLTKNAILSFKTDIFSSYFLNNCSMAVNVIVMISFVVYKIYPDRQRVVIFMALPLQELDSLDKNLENR